MTGIMKTAVFMDVTPYSLVGISHCIFRVEKKVEESFIL
jgi:hypothetical protein